MKRLTDEHWRNFDPWECCGQDKYCQRGCHDEGGCANGCIVPKLYARLARYEDTVLEPEELEYFARAKRGERMVTDEELRQAGVSQTEIDRLFEIAVAASEGRLVVLPCKLHELVWYIEDGEVFDDRPFDVSFGRPSGRSENAILFECENGFSFYAGDFGKSVFATEEEAEAALRKETPSC